MHLTDILDYAEAQLARACLHRQKKAEQRAEADAVRGEVDRMTADALAEVDAAVRETVDGLREFPR